MLRAVRPVQRSRELQPRIAARWTGHRADPAQLADFLRITGLPDGPTLPLLYPHTFGFRLAMVVLTHPAMPVPIWRVLQVRNHLAQRHPIPRDARMDFATELTAGRAVAKGAEFDLRTTVEVGGAIAWESMVTFFAAGRFGDPQPAPPPAVPPSAIGPVASEWTLRNADHWRFGRYTGDYNGIHLWDAYARRFGFPRALYHPPRVIGECLARLVDAAANEPQRLDVWLKGPVPHGATVRLCAAPPEDPGAFALFVEQGRPCIVGRWQ
jgi:hypothetical protein